MSSAPRRRKSATTARSARRPASTRRRTRSRESAADVAARRQALAMTAASALTSADARLGELIRQLGTHHPVVSPDPFKTLVSSITQQQISMSAAASVERRLRDLCPQRRITPQAILDLGPERLRTAGLSRQKATYLLDLSENFASGELSTRKLRRMTDEEVIEATTRVRGIGRWTAEMLLMFCLERPDVWPVDDLGLRKAVGAFLGLAERPDAETMRAAGEPYRPYRTYASWYLWRSLEGSVTMPGVAV